MSTIGIKGIGCYIPEARANNAERLSDFEIEESFLIDKLGVRQRAIKAPGEDTLALCLNAFENLQSHAPLAIDQIDCLVVVTQNPGIRIPHVSARLHGALGVGETCACFDISLGCSGYVYSLSAIESFMSANDLRNGLLFTADPYSPIIDAADKNTALLFGDAATCTHLGSDPVFETGKFTFGTIGTESAELTCPGSGSLSMNGRAVFNFAAKTIPGDIRNLLERNQTDLAAIDRFIFHQGSKYIVDTLTKLMRLDPSKVALDILDYGNTVSSSIPLILAQELERPHIRRVVLSGFGAGLSWASALLTRTDPHASHH